jgi:hypothetical protein
MNAQLRRRLEMAGRVREFLRAHKTDGVGEGLGLAKLEELVQRGEVLASQQRSGIVANRSSTKRRRNLRRALQSKLLLYLRAVGAVAAKENAELAVQFQVLPSNASHEALLTMARGMSEQLLGDLAGALGEFELTLRCPLATLGAAAQGRLIEATRAAQRQHIGASADLEAVAAEIAEQVRVLDGLVRYRFGDNAELMGAWASARNVLGPFKPKAGDQPKAA